MGVLMEQVGVLSGTDAGACAIGVDGCAIGSITDSRY